MLARWFITPITSWIIRRTGFDVLDANVQAEMEAWAAFTHDRNRARAQQPAA